MNTLDNFVVTILAFVLAAVSLFLLEAQGRRFETERETWKTERKDLMDRIQAPSFAEYTAKVIREKKAEQPEEKVEPVDFVS